MIRSSFILILILCCSQVNAQTPCQNGFAGAYECENIDLLAHVLPSEIGGATTNEIWGWTDPIYAIEYGILGTSTGVQFFDISDPYHPLLLGRLPTYTTNSLWRTFRTYQDYLFVGSEAPGHGMQIFDLTNLRDVVNPPVTFSEDAHYDGFGDCHTLSICEETGYAFACGTNTYLGGPHIVNIQDPLNPTLAGGYDVNGYTHESVVMVYDGPDTDYTGKTVAFCFNGAVPLPLTIIDVTDPSDASQISFSTYPGKRYCHQGWLTEDKNYLLLDDELDEYYDLADSMHTHIFDVRDLDFPLYMGYYVGGTAIDHNIIIDGNLAYESNYTDGLTLLDVTNIADTSLTRVAYFDHYLAGDPEVFQGEWMSYPFFESGIVAVTDIYDGMLLLKPNFIHITSPGEVCALDTLSLTVSLANGFPGPYVVTFFGLPGQLQTAYNTEGISAPIDFEINIFGFELLEGPFNFEVTISGQNESYSRTVTCNVIQPTIWYSDSDGDGYGSDQQLSACYQPEQYSQVSGDCDDNNSTVYPGAPGSFDELDNNCNGLIDEDEIGFCADLNGDDLITVTDVQIMMANMGCTGVDCIGDINEDSITSLADLIILIADFGEPCP